MDIIHKKINEIVEIEEYLQTQGELGYKLTFGEFSRKYIILSIGSYIEDRISNILKKYFESFNNSIISNFTNKFAIERNFYKMFDWKSDTISHFLNLFGDEFKENFEEKIKLDKKLEDGMLSFIQLIRYRNNLIHRNVLSQQLDLSISDIQNLYNSSFYMIDIFERDLLSYVEARIICCSTVNLDESLENLAKCYLMFK